MEDADAAAAQCVLLSEQYGGSPDPQVRLDTSDFLWNAAKTLASRGSTGAALEVADELRSRFAGDALVKVGFLVAAAFSLIAELQVAKGQRTEALTTNDEALALVAASSELTRRGAAVALLLAKAKILTNDDRREESIIVLDGAFAAIAAAAAGGAALRTRQAAVAVVAQLDDLFALGRYAEARDLAGKLAEVLAEVHTDKLPSRGPASPAASETLLAAELAGIINDSRYWAVFEGHEYVSPSGSASRALQLYSVSDPWPVSASTAGPVHAAAAIVRIVADGYALLAKEWDPAERDSLPLPQQAELEQLLRQHGVDDWARAAGHPLKFSVAEVAGTQTFSTDSNSYAVSASVVRDIVKCLHVYEFAHILTRSELGLEALRYKQLAEISIFYLRFTVELHRRLVGDGAPLEVLAVGVACRLIAGGLFARTHSEGGSAAAFVPSRASVRELLYETGGYAWLRDQNVALPTWIEPDDS